MGNVVCGTPGPERGEGGRMTPNDASIVTRCLEKLNPELSWEELKAATPGTIYHDEVRGGVRELVMRGPVALAAYAGVPLDSKLAKIANYDHIDVPAHGGLTFGRVADNFHPAGWYWYGWDYAHLGDQLLFDTVTNLTSPDYKRWLPGMVIKDSQRTWRAFRKLLRAKRK